MPIECFLQRNQISVVSLFFILRPFCFFTFGFFIEFYSVFQLLLQWAYMNLWTRFFCKWIQYTNAFIASICHGFYLKKDIKGSCHRRIYVEQPHHTDLMKRGNLHGNDYYNVNEMHTWNMEYQRVSRVVLLKSLSEFYASLNSVECYSWSDLISFIREKRSETTFSVCISIQVFVIMPNHLKQVASQWNSTATETNCQFMNRYYAYQFLFLEQERFGWNRDGNWGNVYRTMFTHFFVVIIIMNIHALARNIFWGLLT